MTPYATLDYLSDLTATEMSAARSLSFSPSSTNTIGWDNTASIAGDDNNAILRDTFVFNAKNGATYDIFSTSFFDPYLLRIFDNLGNVIVANSEDDDYSRQFIRDAFYNNDSIFDWVAPYTGNYFVKASWNQGSFYKFYSLIITEDVDTVPASNFTAGVIKTGTVGNDIIVGTAGNDNIDGGAGTDVAVFSAARASYTVTRAGAVTTVQGKSGTDGTDTLTNVERLKFSDFSVALDVFGNAGITAKILGAVFGKAAVFNKEYVGIGLKLLDEGMSSLNLMKLALDVKLGTGASNETVVNLLYSNVVGIPPSPNDLIFFQGLINNGTHTQASLGMLAADTELNVNNVSLVGIATSGLEYLPQG